MTVDCAIIGGGPAGLNAALVLGRARRNVLLFDDNKPRDAVTQHSHDFVTRDGVPPTEFRALSHAEIARYPSVEPLPTHIRSMTRQGTGFELITENGETYTGITSIKCTQERLILFGAEANIDIHIP